MKFPVSITWLGLRCSGILAFVVFALTSLAQACLWDWDTLQMERRRFPGVLEMITGKFVRHSPAYYEWRIGDRTRRMRSPAEDPALADDLAVAYSKLSRHTEGIALLEQVLAAHPVRYETLANLGTIHMLAGDWKTGKEYIDRAIVINPNAHFGREKYQSLLAEYVLTERKLPHVAAESTTVTREKGYLGFAKFVLQKNELDRYVESVQVNDELAAAQNGVLGMMHFADYQSPLLLEVLGDLLIAWPSSRDNALQLAARAYYRVAQLADDETIKSQFKSVAKNMVYGHLDYIRFRDQGKQNEDGPGRDELEKLSADLQRELAEGQAFFASIQADEQRWIDDGKNVDAEFAAKYYDSLDSTVEAAQTQLATEPLDVRTGPFDKEIRRAWLVVGTSLVGFIALVAGCVFVHRRFVAKLR